jgi:hypothetical protein
MKKIAPNIHIAIARLEMFERVKTEFFHSLKGSTGSSV